jgi:hypothetical protein
MGAASERDRRKRNGSGRAAADGSLYGGLLDGVGPACGELTAASLCGDAFRRSLAAFSGWLGGLLMASAGRRAVSDGLSQFIHRESMSAEANLIRLRPHAAAGTAEPADAAIDKRHDREDERQDRRRRPSLTHPRAG